MPRWHTDEVDTVMQVWARQWVEAFLRDPDRAGRMIGPCSCTLGRVIERHDGASSSTSRDRHWPEVFLGDGLLAAVILKSLTESQREVLMYHYVARVYGPEGRPLRYPLKQRVIAGRMGVSLQTYYNHRDAAKSAVRACLCLDSKALAHARRMMVHGAKLESVPTPSGQRQDGRSHG